MANIEIPNLPAAIGLTGDEQMEAVQNGDSVRITPAQIAALASPGVGIQAGASSVSNGTVVFANSNGVTFGMSNSQITASVAGGGGGGNLTISGGASSISSGQLIFSNSNGVSFGLNGSTMTASVAAAGGAQTGISGISAGTQLQTVGTLQFVNSNSITFGMSNSSQITASFSQSVQTQASGNIPRTGFTTNATAGTALVGTHDTAGLNLGVPAWITTAAQSNQVINSLNGSTGQISLNVGSSLSASTNGSSITFGLASNITTALQSAGAYLTTAAQSSVSNVSGVIAASNNTGGGVATLSGNISFSNANSMTFYTSAGNAIVGSFSTSQSVQTQASGNIVGAGFTTTTTAGSVMVGTHNSLGLSLGVPAWLTVAAGGGGFSGGVSTGGNTLGNTGTQTGQVVFAGGNNITLSVSSAAGGAQTITISGANAGGAQTGISGVIAGTQTQTAGTVSFANSNGITFGMSNSSIVTASYNSTQFAGTGTTFNGANISGSLTLNSNGLNMSLSGGAGGGGGVAIAASNSTFTSGTVVMSAAGGALTISNGAQSVLFSVPATSSISGTGIVSISVNGSTVSIGAPAYSGGISGGNTAGNTGTVSNQIVFAGGNNITLSGSTNAAGMTVTVSGANAGGAQTGISGMQVSNATYTSGTVTFQNANGISFGSSGANGISASYTVPTVPTAYVSSINGSSGALSLNVGSSLSSSVNGSSITFGLASNITTALQSAGAYLTTAAQSNQVVNSLNGSTGQMSLNVGSSLSSSVNGSSITFGLASNITTALQSAGAYLTTAAQSNQVVNSLNGSTGQISLNVGSSLSASTNGSSITFGLASNITTALQSAGAYLTTALASNASIIAVATNNTGGGAASLSGVVSFSNANGLTFYSSAGNAVVASYNSTQFAGTGTTFGGTNVSGSMTMNSNGLVLSLSAPTPGGGAAINVSAGTTSGNLQTIVFSNSNGVSFGLSGSTITASGGAAGAAYTASWFQPEIWGNTITSSNANGTLYIRPIELANYQDFDYVMFQQSLNTSASTVSFSGSNSTGASYTSGGTGSWGQTGTFILFSRVNTNETNASYNSIISFFSQTYSMGAAYSVTLSNSSFGVNGSSGAVVLTTAGAISFIQNIDNTGGFTTTAITTSNTVSFSSSSTNQNSFSSTFGFSFVVAGVTGIRPMFVPGAGTDIPPGGYWAGIIQSTTTGSTGYALQRAVVGAGSVQMLYMTASNQGSYLELGNTAGNIANSNYRLGFGSYSSSGNTTGQIPLTAITSMASNASLWLAIAGQTR